MSEKIAISSSTYKSLLKKKIFYLAVKVVDVLLLDLTAACSSEWMQFTAVHIVTS